MHRFPRTGRLLLVALTSCLALTPALFSACKQGENERCQIDDDCMPDYFCYLASGNDRILGGTCRSKTAPNNPGADLSTTPAPDMSTGTDM